VEPVPCGQGKVPTTAIQGSPLHQPPRLVLPRFRHLVIFSASRLIGLMLGDEAGWMANNRARVWFGSSLPCEPGVVYLSLSLFSLTLLFLSSQSSHLFLSYKPILELLASITSRQRWQPLSINFRLSKKLELSWWKESAPAGIITM
jgi:hypothetical protein